MKKRLFSGVVLLGGLLMPLLPVQSVHADEVAELKTTINETKQQVDIDKQYSVQLKLDQKVVKDANKEDRKLSKDELKNVSKVQIAELKSNRTKKFKYHKRNVDQVNKTLTKYH